MLPRGDDIVAMSGYIRAYRDVRGKFASEGLTSSAVPCGLLNPSPIDNSTDTYDTIAWLVKTRRRQTARWGSSYVLPRVPGPPGLINPHPALKAAVPIAPMVDTWKGDDWFHHGAFRQQYARLRIRPDLPPKATPCPWARQNDDYAAFSAPVRPTSLAGSSASTSCRSGSA